MGESWPIQAHGPNYVIMHDSSVGEESERDVLSWVEILPDSKDNEFSPEHL